MERTRTSDTSPATATLVLVAIWGACDALFGAAGVFAGHLGRHWVDVSSIGLMAFVMSLNVVIAAFVTGSIFLLHSEELPIAQTVLFLFVMAGGVVGSFALSGWHLGTSDDGAASIATQRLDGIAIWAIVTLVMLVSVWLFRPELLHPLRLSVRR